jgi:hypothetical protein
MRSASLAAVLDDAGDQLVVEHADAARLDDDVGGARFART